MTGRILPPISAILPLWLVRSMVGWRETREVWPALAVSGLSFALTQFYWSNYQDSGLVDIVAALVSLLTMVAFLKVWQAQEPTRVPVGRNAVRASSDPVPVHAPVRSHSSAAVLKGWSPFLLASVVHLPVGEAGSQPAALTFKFLQQPVPYLHRAVLRMPPVAPEPTPEDAIADLNVLAVPGTAVFASAVLAALLLGMSPVGSLVSFVRTLVRLITRRSWRSASWSAWPS